MSRSRYHACEEGYEAPLCTVCSMGYRMSGTGCKLCTGFSYLAVGVLTFVGCVFCLMVVESSTKLRHSRVVRTLHINSAGRQVRALFILVQEMFNDIKVFLSLYQVLSTMGQTMEITYPAIISDFIDLIRQFATLDLFALPGLGCIDLSSRYVFKFWFSMTLPPIIIAFIFGLYRFRVRQSTRPLDAASVVLHKVNAKWLADADSQAQAPMGYSSAKHRWMRASEAHRSTKPPGCTYSYQPHRTRVISLV